EKGQGWRFRVEKEKMSWDKRRLAMDTVVRMKDSKLALSFRDRIIQPRTLSRSVTAECLQESYLLDFVLRFRFAKKFFDYSEIAGRRFRHQNTNLYHEYPVKQARLKWKGRKGGVLVRVTHSNVPNNMKP